MSEASRFDPGRYLKKVNGGDYLEVKWRLVWLREAHPDASIETELVSHSDQEAIFRARVTLPSGASATGYGSEGYADFRDYVEKAETKSIGRALAALGFGTQFCPDHEFGADRGRVVDAPIDRGRRMGPNGGNPGNGGEQPATPRQIKFIQAIAREHGISDADLTMETESLYGVAVEKLTRRDASAFIERLQSRRNATETAS